MITNIDNERKDFFLMPIPKWITLWGFWWIMIMFFIILFCVSIVRFNEKLEIDIIITKEKNVIARTNFRNFKKISDNQKILIAIPIRENNIEGQLNKSQSWIENDSILIPISIDNCALDSIRYVQEIKTNGSIILSQGSLLNKILFKNN